MDRIINEMHEAGIKVFLGTPAYSIPAYTLHQQGQTDMAVQALIADLEADEVTATRLAAFQLSRIGSPARQAVRALQELMQGIPISSRHLKVVLMPFKPEYIIKKK